MQKRDFLRFMHKLNFISKGKFSKKNKAIKSEYNLLKKSELFDCKWYLAHYPDVKAAKIDPIIHFLIHGWRENRNPGPLFITKLYLQYNPDVKKAQINPLLHYIIHGKKEERNIGYNLSQYKAIKKSGYFDKLWYMKQYKDVFEQNMDPIIHYMLIGWKLGYNPSYKFNTSSYIKKHPECQCCPLLHIKKKKTKNILSRILFSLKFLLKSHTEIKIINNSIYFDSKWYITQYPDVKKTIMLPAEHYLIKGWKEGLNPSKYFNTVEYLHQNPDVEAANMNPLLHYELAGKKEGRTGGISDFIEKYFQIKESKYFDIKYYCKNNPDVVKAHIDPIEHYLLQGWKEGRLPSKMFKDKVTYYPKDKNPILYLEHHNMGSQENEYIDYLLSMYNDKSHFVGKIDYQQKFDTSLKLIAFYLPQYHLFKENEEWHGRGFTEWSNVTKAIPHFIGHRQPQLPIDVGFYDLSNIDIMKRQTELAKQYGLHGFCFHYYWFSGKKLMEKPIYNYLEHTEIDFPFCLCWANENWSKLWDGGNKEVLMKQELKAEDDEKFARDIIPFFLDKRYIRVENKPLFIVYRPALFEQKRFCKFIDILRSECKKAGLEDLYILVSNSFAFNDNPYDWHVDGIVEFPPNYIAPEKIKKTLISDKSQISVMDCAKYINNRDYLYETPYNLFKTVFPSWDNTARKAYTGATCFYGETPRLYRQWLQDCVKWTAEHHSEEEQLVFINAWNEWAEGAHLEPDTYYGYAYLNETRIVVENSSQNVKKIIYVGHDANYNGAQLLTLNIIKSMRQHFNYSVELLLLNGGELVTEYSKYANVHILSSLSGDEVDELISDLKSRGYDNAITNTIITGKTTEYLHKHDIFIVSLIHELPKIIKHYHAEPAGMSIAENSDKIVFASSYVKDAFAKMFVPDNEKLLVMPQGLYKTNPLAENITDARQQLRQKLGLPKTAKIVLFVGFGDKRKGMDLYIDVMDKVVAQEKNIYFVVVGDVDPTIWQDKLDIINQHNEHIIFCGKQTDTSIYYAAADVFLLTSREDPFPSVVMEAFECGLPVIAFKGAGGFSDIVNDNTGKLVAFEDTDAMAKETIKLLKDKVKRQKISKTTKELIKKDFDWDTYVGKLLNLSHPLLKKVSVIVPNYNYEKYIEQRLDSIINQTYPIYELIVLDDCSTDNSLDVIKKYQSQKYPSMKIIPNQKNSGSVFNQWAKGIEKATGDYIWIAEADDLCESTFLSECMKKFNNTEVVLSYTQSQIIDENNKKTSDNYLFYTNDISTEKWQNDYIEDGVTEIAQALCVKNTIPNVSAVVFKKFDIKPYLKEIKTYKVGGDLYLYMQLLTKGKIGFCSKALNKHRRHSGSVTVSKENNRKHFDEIVSLQKLGIKLSNPTQETMTKIENYRKYVKEYLLGEKIMKVVFCGAMKSPHLLPRDFMGNEGKISVGYNTGNFIIGEYGRRTIQGDECFECGFPWSIPMPAEEFNEKFDNLVIFAANWLAHYMKYDFSPAIEWLKKIKVPVTLIGLGAQFDMKNLNKAEYVKNLEPSLVKLFQVIATKNKSISTRGYITAELLHEIGVDNTNVTGCPTWFVNGNKQQPLVKKDFSQNFKISMHADVSNLHAYARLYDLAKGIKDKTYILQSEFDLIPLILGDKINAESLKKKYMLRDEIINQPEWGHIFGSLTDWENYVKSRDLVIGMRIHGTIVALKNNTPAILFYHDGRTFEFVDVFDLPHWKIDDLFDESKTLEYFYEKTDFTKMNKKYHFLLANYKLFLQENGIVFHENDE